MKKKSLNGRPEKSSGSKIKTLYIVLGISLAGAVGYRLYKKRNPTSNDPVIATTNEQTLPFAMDGEPSMDLKPLHRDQLEALFHSSTSSNELKDLIVNELTSRGYQVMRSRTDRYNDMTVVTGELLKLAPARVSKYPEGTLLRHSCSC